MYLLKNHLEVFSGEFFFKFIENIFPTDRIIQSIELSKTRWTFRGLKDENPVKEILYLGRG